MSFDISAFCHGGDLVASRVFEGQLYPVGLGGDEADAPSLEDQSGVIVNAGSFRVGDRVFDLSAPGVYRFQPAGRPGRQAAVLPDTVSGIASVTAELGALGNADRNKGWPVLSRIACHRRLLMHCVQFSNLSVHLADQVGLTGRTWLMWNYDAVEAGDLLSSHAISELSRKDGSETRLYDLSFGVELIVEPGKTDFASFQAAIRDGGDVQSVRISHAFGFEYGSRFFNPNSDDFDLDALAASPEILNEAYQRLARGAYVIGKNLQEESFVTPQTLSCLSTLPEGALSPAKKAELKAATIVSQPGASGADAPSDSGLRIGDDAVAYQIAAGELGAIPRADGDPARAETLDLDQASDAGVDLSSGAVASLGEDVLDLREDGVYRLRDVAKRASRQIVVASRDPFRFAVHLLELLASGALHDDMSVPDLRIAARSAKAVAQGDTAASFVTGFLTTAGIPFRLWRLPSDLSANETRWPLPVRLACLELPDASGRMQLLDLDRGLVLKSDGAESGFPEFERSVLAQGRLEALPVCRTPRFAYGTVDGKTALTPDLIMPFWLGDIDVAAALWLSALGRYPAIARDAANRECTTQASQARARNALSDGSVSRETAIRVLDCANIV